MRFTAPMDGTRDAVAMLRAALARDTGAWNTLADNCVPGAALAAMASLFINAMGDRYCEEHIDAWLRNCQREILAAERERGTG